MFHLIISDFLFCLGLKDNSVDPLLFLFCFFVFKQNVFHVVITVGGNNERDRLRFNSSYLSGVDMASKLMGAGAGGESPFQVVGSEPGLVQVMPAEQGTLQYLCAAAAATAPPPAPPPSQPLQLPPVILIYF